jgi:hypothetical protein
VRWPVAALHMDVLRARDKDGEISKRYVKTLIGTLRKTCGPEFAFGMLLNSVDPGAPLPHR